VGHPWHASSFTWYWDNDVIFTGGTGARGCGIIGNIIIRGNFTNYCGDNLYWNEIGLENCRVPSEAWREYAKITKTTGDTAAINEYPADNGYQTCRPTFRFGAETWTGGQNPLPPETPTWGSRDSCTSGATTTLKDRWTSTARCGWSAT